MSQIKMSWSCDNPLQFSSMPDTKQTVVCQYGLEVGTTEAQMKSLTEMGTTSTVPAVLFLDEEVVGSCGYVWALLSGPEWWKEWEIVRLSFNFFYG